MRMITLREVLPHFSNKKAEVARAFSLSRQAIGGWGLDDPIPELYELRLRYELMPEVFGPRKVKYV